LSASFTKRTDAKDKRAPKKNCREAEKFEKGISLLKQAKKIKKKRKPT